MLNRTAVSPAARGRRYDVLRGGVLDSTVKLFADWYDPLRMRTRQRLTTPTRVKL